MLDYSILLKQIITAYNRTESTWEKQEVIDFFKMFYRNYMFYIGGEPRRLKTDTIQRIIEDLPSDDMFEYSIEAYEEMIPKYFETKFEDCDYSLPHFMSGSIRQMRFYECCY